MSYDIAQIVNKVSALLEEIMTAVQEKDRLLVLLQQELKSLQTAVAGPVVDMLDKAAARVEEMIPEASSVVVGRRRLAADADFEWSVRFSVPRRSKNYSRNLQGHHEVSETSADLEQAIMQARKYAEFLRTGIYPEKSQ